jgi:23S rRNA (adenine2503-C2)-methyltransferase
MSISQNQKPDLRDLSVGQVQTLIADLGEKPYRASQVLQWLYKGNAVSIDDMTNLSKAFRARLKKAARLDWYEPVKVEYSQDGTSKLLHEFRDGTRVESVLMPEEDHHTLCVSSQVGCRMNCAFCRTAGLGLTRNLTPSEIMAQILYARTLVKEDKPLTNLVFMGMGEPLDNLDNLLVSLDNILGPHGLQMSQRKVTVSTSGRVDKLPALADATWAALAVSLNAPDDELRSKLMPINRRYNLAKLHRALMEYPLKPTRRITLEYVLLGGVNDSLAQAEALAGWAKGLRCKINLIPFNPFEGSVYRRPDPRQVWRFKEYLADRHLTVMERKARGCDISAACGTLAARA